MINPPGQRCGLSDIEQGLLYPKAKTVEDHYEVVKSDIHPVWWIEFKKVWSKDYKSSSSPKLIPLSKCIH